MSKTKNVPKLTSKISSSMKVTCGPGAASHNGTSGVGPTAPVAEEPPASAIDTPTTPATGTAFFRCFCFVRGIVETSHPLARVIPAALFVRLPRTPRKTTPLTDRASPGIAGARPPPKWPTVHNMRLGTLSCSTLRKASLPPIPTRRRWVTRRTSMHLWGISTTLPRSNARNRHG